MRLKNGGKLLCETPPPVLLTPVAEPFTREPAAEAIATPFEAKAVAIWWEWAGISGTVKMCVFSPPLLPKERTRFLLYNSRL